jgi:hypothetical protein
MRRRKTRFHQQVVQKPKTHQKVCCWKEKLIIPACNHLVDSLVLARIPKDGPLGVSVVRNKCGKVECTFT